MRQFLSSVLEIFEVALVAVGAVFLIRTFLIQPFLVSGASMVPNFFHGDYLLVDELTYRFREPMRGEVAVFHYPNDESTFFIKRIIGLPGEHVEIGNGNITVTNDANPKGTVLHESYLPQGAMTNVRAGGNSSFSLKEGEYLALGDNRAYSFDSRDWGVLMRREIVGMVRLRLWPLTAFTVFAAPSYGE